MEIELPWEVICFDHISLVSGEHEYLVFISLFSARPKRLALGPFEFRFTFRRYKKKKKRLFRAS